MKKEKSCGAIIFTRDGDRLKYVIIHQTNGIYCFPKGHMENGETEEETALREIREEVGLDVTLIDGFRQPDEYKFSLNGDLVIQKEVVYFLAEFEDQTPHPQESELFDVYLMTLEEALDTLSFDGMKQFLREADGYIRKNYKFY
ncbi:MAG: NUDIX domain-containing protein [Ruminococcaceae bacterium]|nr:NUDIX domain-containing protein [Oscillospiraceae bacterium]